MRGRIEALIIDNNLGSELLFYPIPSAKKFIYPNSHFRFVLTACRYPTTAQTKRSEHFYDVAPLIREVLLQYRACMPPLMHFVFLANEIRQNFCTHNSPCELSIFIYASTRRFSASSMASQISASSFTPSKRLICWMPVGEVTLISVR